MNRLFQLSKRNFLYIIIIMLTMTLTLLLLIKEEKELVIISRDYPYSIYHSDNYETIDIELLTNNPESYHFNNNYISSSKFYNEDEELSVSVKDIVKSSHSVSYQGDDFYIVTFKFTLPFISNELYIEMSDVFLELIYDNSQTISLRIGEVNYLFDDSNNSDITLSNLSATHEVVNGYNTIGGVNLELSNSSTNNIIITDITLLSSSVYLNESKIVTNKTCDYTSTVKDCIGVEYYYFNEEYNDILLNTLLGKNNTLELYLPLLYDKKTSFIYEFSIVIEYEKNDQKNKLIIDNFPYMKTSIFTTFNEEEFHVYTFTNNN